MNYYAYYLHETKEFDIVNEWSKCKEKTCGVSASFKKFGDFDMAKNWLSNLTKKAGKIKIKNK